MFLQKPLIFVRILNQFELIFEKKSKGKTAHHIILFI